MKIFHVSDTHLGYSAFAKLDPVRGINQREADFYDSFGRFVELSLRERPDLILHTGDLFDSVRPSNRAISFALAEIRKIADAGIGFVAISGNHETPRLKETGSVFRILEQLSGCDFAYEHGLRRIERDGLEILAIPHTTEEHFQMSLREVKGLKKERLRVVLMHAGVLGIGIFRMNEINELMLGATDISPDSDYVALGHYHNYVQVTKNCCYAGSTERLSISEAGVEKGFVSIDLESGKRRFIPLPTRTMIDVPSLDLADESASGATSAIMGALESKEFEDAIARIVITGLSREVRRDIDMNRIRKITQKALNFELKFTGDKDEQLIQGETPHIGQLEEEFSRYIAKIGVSQLDKKRLEMEALELFAEKEE